jgi:hypothetical protein
LLSGDGHPTIGFATKRHDVRTVETPTGSDTAETLSGGHDPERGRGQQRQNHQATAPTAPRSAAALEIERFRRDRKERPGAMVL